MIQAAPNKARVIADVRNIRETNDPQVILADLSILSAEPIPGYEDFVSRYIGKTIESKLLNDEINSSDESAVELIVTFKGDESGGSFFAQKWPKQ